jgi:small subunit ribosomal protein S9
MNYFSRKKIFFMHEEQKNNLAIGRRKTATSQSKLINGNGKILINNRDGLEYFQYNPKLLLTIQFPLILLNLEHKIDIIVKCCGGGLVGQAESIKLGVSRALCKIDVSNRILLKTNGLMIRNSKIKERKKYGLKKARKSPQFSKR